MSEPQKSSKKIENILCFITLQLKQETVELKKVVQPSLEN